MSILKVSGLWRMFAMFSLGACFGIFIAIKYIAPPSDDIRIGSIKIKGKNSTITAPVDISQQDQDTDKPKEKRKLLKRRDK